MSLVDRVPWTQQPQVDVGIDWTNPISQGLVFLENAAATNALSTGAPTLIFTKGGRAFSNLSAANYRSYQRAIPITSAKEVTMIVMASATANFASNAIFAVGSSTVANSFFAIASSTTNVVGPWIRDSAGTDQNIGGAPFDGVMRVYGGVHSNAENRMEAWTSTEGLTASTSPTTKTTFTALDRVAFGCLLRSTAAQGASNPTIAMGAIWNRALSATEMRSVLANPWQLFEPLPANNRKIWIGASLADTGSPKVIKTTQVKQPQVPVLIDRANPLGSRLRYASTLGPNLTDTISGRAGVPSGGPYPKIGAKGTALEFVSANSQGVVIPGPDLVTNFPLTVSCWVRFFDLNSSNGRIVYSLTGTNYNAIFGQVGAGVPNGLVLNARSAGGLQGYSGTAAGVVDGVWNHFVVVHRSTSSELYVNGVPQTITTAVNTNWGEPTVGSASSIGYRASLTGLVTRYFEGGVQDLYVFDGELSAAEAQSLYKNHWQIFKPFNKPVWLSEGVTASSNLFIPNLSLPTYVPGSLGPFGFKPRVTATWS